MPTKISLDFYTGIFTANQIIFPVSPVRSHLRDLDCLLKSYRYEGREGDLPQSHLAAFYHEISFVRLNHTSARSFCWGVADASAIDVAVVVRHRIGVAIGGAYEVYTRCVRGLYDLQLVYEVMRPVFGR